MKKLSLIVQKYGGTSLKNTELIFNAAEKAINDYKEGNNVIVVVSAQGDLTDRLISKSKEVNDSPSKRELDVLLCAGEQISASLMAMAIEKLGFPVVSLLGWQAGIKTSPIYSNAVIAKIDANRIQKELDKKNIVVIAGFQGINKYEDITTLGRGGSDTTAVGVASTLNANRCKIYTDVEGVFTADPGYVKNALKLDTISYDEMLALSTSGAKVLNNRAVEIGKRHNVEIEVLSSTSEKPGTIVKESNNMEKRVVSGVTKSDNISFISILNLKDELDLSFKLFSKISSKNIDLDTIFQNIKRNGKRDIFFTVKKEDLNICEKILKEYLQSLADDPFLETKKDVSKVSVVGAGIAGHPGVVSKIFEALYTAGIEVITSSSSEIKVSLLVNRKDSEDAVIAIHDAFF